MALRVNADAKEKEIDIQRVRDDDDGDGGIDHGRALAAFVDAFMNRDPEILAQARNELVAAMGAEGMVEAAAVAGNFQRMVRIADSTGIPVDDSSIQMTQSIRSELHLNEFRSARNTFNRES